MTLSGCGTALVTPFRGDGSLDEETLGKLVEWQIDRGIRFLVACGTTGETPTLNHEEWLRVIGIVAGAELSFAAGIGYVRVTLEPFATCNALPASSVGSANMTP